jgi:hypothetical protein
MSTAFAVFIVKPTGYIHSQVFTETAHCVHSGLINLGYDAILTDEHTVEGRRLIVVGPNLLPFAGIHVLPEGTILYNLEQYAHWSNPFLRDDRYVLWDFSAENSRRLGLKAKAILPVGYCSCMTHIQHAQKKDIDVLFIGSPSPRRSEILMRLQRNGIRTQECFGAYGAERDTLIARAKVQINIHYAPGALMEQPRLAYLMANNCVVLSERSSFEPENETWGAGCTLADYDDLPLTAEFLVDASSTTSKDLREKALRFMTERPIENFLADALGKTL